MQKESQKKENATPKSPRNRGTDKKNTDKQSDNKYRTVTVTNQAEPQKIEATQQEKKGPKTPRSAKKVQFIEDIESGEKQRPKSGRPTKQEEDKPQTPNKQQRPKRADKQKKEEYHYVRVDRKDKPEEPKETTAEESKKPQNKKQRDNQKRKSNIPDIFFQKHEKSEDITKMRQKVKKVWKQIEPLKTSLEQAKQLELKEGESIDEETKLIETQIEALQKAKEKSIETHYSITAERMNIKEFKVEKVLNNEVSTKQIYLLGKLKGDPTNTQAILICRKTEFKEEEMLNKLIYRQDQYHHNNEFRKFWTQMSNECSKVNTELIYPATEKFISKYTRQEKVVVVETAQIYDTITKPLFLDGMDLSHCNWMYSILDGEKEQDTILYQNESFLVQKDYKFNEGDLRTLYCLAFPKQKDLKTVRDLRAEHLPMLKAMREESIKAICAKFKVSAGQIKAYFHYQPTFYHLHVHLTHQDVQCDRACVDLDQVIANIELMPDYYAKCTLVYSIGVDMPLGKILLEKGVVDAPIAEEAEPIEKKEESKE